MFQFVFRLYEAFLEYIRYVVEQKCSYYGVQVSKKKKTCYIFKNVSLKILFFYLRRTLEMSAFIAKDDYLPYQLSCKNFESDF